MGGTVSAGRDNNSLVDNLVASDYIKSEMVERVFRAVDRGDYFLPESRGLAYKDLAWKLGDLHISAPCIYSDVMEWLKLKAGLSFLNLGSGTGYLSTMAGLILGTGGINHGVELHSGVVDYAIEKLDSFISNSTAIDEFDFCYPKFTVGNCLCLSSFSQKYDRVYCGAACPKVYENNLKSLLKIGGILVMPLQGKLMQIKRKSDTEWVSKSIQHVSFASLITPTPDNLNSNVYIGDISPPSLQEMCRSQIRNILREIVYREKPHIKNKPTPKKRRSSQSRARDIRAFSLPIRDEDSDNDEFDFSILHNLDRDTGSREMNALLRLVLSMRRDVVDVFYPDPRNEGENEEVESDEDDNERSAHEMSDGEQPEDVGMNESNDAEDSRASFCDNPEQHENRDHISDGSFSSSTTDETKGSADDEVEANDVQMNSSGQPESSTSHQSNLLSPPGSSSKHERKRHYSEGDEDERTDESLHSETESETQNDKVKKMKRKPPPQPSEWDVNRQELSDCLREKVSSLPLPTALKLYVNMNRHL